MVIFPATFSSTLTTLAIMSYAQNNFSQTVFHGPSLLQRMRSTVRQITVKTQLEQLRATGRYDCFKLEWHPSYGNKNSWPVDSTWFWDSDLAKWIEGACYFLEQEFDPEIDAAIQELVQMIRSAQRSDGYLNVHFIVVEPEARWSNIRDQHELYGPPTCPSSLIFVQSIINHLLFLFCRYFP